MAVAVEAAAVAAAAAAGAGAAEVAVVVEVVESAGDMASEAAVCRGELAASARPDHPPTLTLSVMAGSTKSTRPYMSSLQYPPAACVVYTHA